MGTRMGICMGLEAESRPRQQELISEVVADKSLAQGSKYELQH